MSADEEVETRCSNERHPAGPWHIATPLPLYSWRNRKAVKRYERNQKRWGCGCDVWFHEGQG